MTKAKKYQELQYQANLPAPKFEVSSYDTTAIVDSLGRLRVSGNNGIPEKSIPAFINWLKETFVDEIKTDDRFGESETRKVNYDI